MFREICKISPQKICVHMLHFDTIDQRNARSHISHIALLVDIKNMIIRNGSSTFLRTPSWIVSHSQTTILLYWVGENRVWYTGNTISIQISIHSLV